MMPKSGSDDLAKLATGFVEAVTESEVQMMRVLQAEVEGLTKGAVRPETPEDAARIEAETEAGFDNMPV